MQQGGGVWDSQFPGDHLVDDADAVDLAVGQTDDFAHGHILLVAHECNKGVTFLLGRGVTFLLGCYRRIKKILTISLDLHSIHYYEKTTPACPRPDAHS